MRKLLLPALLAPLLMAGCASPGPTSPISSAPAPSPPQAKVLCPPEATAAITSEPRPPKGINTVLLSSWLSTTFGAAGQDFYEWLSTTHPIWARELAARLVKIETACRTQEAKP